MRRNSMVAMGVALIPWFTVGCFTVHHEYTGTKPMTNAPGLDRPTRIVRHFEKHDRQFFWLHGGVPVGDPLNGLELAGEEIGDHAGVVNLKLRDGQNLFDAAVTHIPCLLSMVCGTWSTWVEGDVVDYVDDDQIMKSNMRRDKWFGRVRERKGGRR